MSNSAGSIRISKTSIVTNGTSGVDTPARTVLGRTGKHMGDAAGKALDVFAGQFFLPEWCFCRFR
jgi:hypothetical protein